MWPGVRRGLQKHWIGLVHVLIQMGPTGGGCSPEEPEGSNRASALALWCWEAGRRAVASPLVSVRKRGWMCLLYFVSLFNQPFFFFLAQKLEFFCSLKNQRAIWKHFLWQVLQPTLSSPSFHFDLGERHRKKDAYNPPETYPITALQL